MHFLSFPPEVLHLILKACDFDSMKMLRETCTLLLSRLQQKCYWSRSVLRIPNLLLLPTRALEVWLPFVEEIEIYNLATPETCSKQIGNIVRSLECFGQSVISDTSHYLTSNHAVMETCYNLQQHHGLSLVGWRYFSFIKFNLSHKLSNNEFLREELRQFVLEKCSRRSHLVSPLVYSVMDSQYDPYYEEVYINPHFNDKPYLRSIYTSWVRVILLMNTNSSRDPANGEPFW